MKYTQIYAYMIYNLFVHISMFILMCEYESILSIAFL